MTKKRLINLGPTPVSCIPTGTASGRKEALAEYVRCLEYEAKLQDGCWGFCEMDEQTGEWHGPNEEHKRYWLGVISSRREDLEAVLVGADKGAP